MHICRGARTVNGCSRTLGVDSFASLLGEAPFHVARKKKAKRFRAVEAVKALARERIGTPPSGKIVLEKKKKPEKHKPTLGKMLGEGE